MQKHCPNCNEPLPDDAVYCRNCGFHLPEKETFLKKHQKPITIIAIILIAAFITIGTISFITDLSYQTVNVGTVSFKIPQEFKENITPFTTETDGGIITISKSWHSETDIIRITAMYSSNVYVDANDINSQIGGEKRNMMGQDGYFRENQNTYSFSFVKHNTLVTVYTTDMDLFSKISVI